jgi:hypothetical protein
MTWIHLLVLIQRLLNCVRVKALITPWKLGSATTATSTFFITCTSIWISLFLEALITKCVRTANIVICCYVILWSQQLCCGGWELGVVSCEDSYEIRACFTEAQDRKGFTRITWSRLFAINIFDSWCEIQFFDICVRSVLCFFRVVSLANEITKFSLGARSVSYFTILIHWLSQFGWYVPSYFKMKHKCTWILQKS